MRNRITSGFTALLLLSLILTSTFGWRYNDGSEDLNWEMYGPRAEKLLIHLYNDHTVEFNALKNGDIDIVDWPLPKTVYEELNEPPYNETIEVVNYGPEFGLYILDLNSNNNQFLGNPPNPAYPSPVADQNDTTSNPLIKSGDGAANNHNPMSSVYLRRAIGYLIDRPSLVADPAIGVDFGYPMYTTMPPALNKYLLNVHDDPSIPWAWKYDPAAANTTLEEGGFKINQTTGYRYWDLNDDDVEDPDEWVELIFYIRSDHAGRSMIGTVLVAEMASINLRVNPQYPGGPGPFFEYGMVKKNFHMYTGGWSLGVDPNHLILWSWDWYWHPGFCYNYGGHNDPVYNEAANNIMYASNQTEAITYAMTAQYQQAYNVLGIPLYCNSGSKVYYKTNVGNHSGDDTEGEAWEGIVNMPSYGIDNTWTFMNMHTNETPCGNGTVIDWGFKVPEVKQLNPVYASWVHDWNILGQVYESLLVRNTSDLGELLPWIAEAFKVDTYSHPTYGNCTKILFTLRDDVMWSDGTPLTVADVHFTFIELWQILSSRGIPGPWWLSNIESLLDFSILDAFNFEVYLDIRSYWTAGWIGCNIILPKHVWKPICETGDPQADMPDPDLIGTGPFKFVEYNSEAGYILMNANPTFHRSTPVTSDIEVNPEGRNKFMPEDGANITVTLDNLCVRGCINSLDINITVAYPNGTEELHQYSNLTVDAGEELEIALPVTWEFGMYGICVAFNVHVCVDCQWYTYSCDWWRAYVTTKQDIVGSTYYDDIGFPLYSYKNQLPTPDFKVDMKDVGRASRAFGSYPGHERWDTVSDINSDGKVDMKDIGDICRMFGWTYWPSHNTRSF